MEAAFLVAVLGGVADAVHHLEPGHDGGDQVPAAVAAFLRDSQRRRQQGGARMHAGTGPGQVVGLEGVSERAVGQCSRRGVERGSPGAQDAAAAAGADTLGIGDDNAAPGEAAALDDDGDSVGDTVLGALDDLGRQFFIAQAGSVFGDADGFVGHWRSSSWPGCYGLLVAAGKGPGPSVVSVQSDACKYRPMRLAGGQLGSFSFSRID